MGAAIQVNLAVARNVVLDHCRQEFRRVHNPIEKRAHQADVERQTVGARRIFEIVLDSLFRNLFRPWQQLRHLGSIAYWRGTIPKPGEIRLSISQTRYGPSRRGGASEEHSADG